MPKKSPCMIVIFGASGDLAAKKLLPALFDLHQQGNLAEGFCILGVARTPFSDESFRDKTKSWLSLHAPAGEAEKIAAFVEKIHYFCMDPASPEGYPGLKERMAALDRAQGNRIYYLAMPPSLYELIASRLGEHGLEGSQGSGWKRLIVEKPFGYDLSSAKALNRKLLNVFSEEQIYRIDHYLGKETVQNVLVARFANGIFEPLWNRNYVHHVEISSVENIGIEERGGYYDQSGALRDMVQNHLLQLLGLVAMEPPSIFDSNAIRNETLKVFQSLRAIKAEEVEQCVIRGQYLPSVVRGKKLPGYREEKGVDPASRTETYLAMKFYVDNWRWGGVPFYIRTGKRLPTRVTEIVVHFKPTPHSLFSKSQRACDACNQLVIRVQPDEGLLLKFGMKIPGAGFEVQQESMNFHYSRLPNVYLPSAYERLLLDCMMGDSMLYIRGDAVEACWQFVAPIQEAWQNDSRIKVYGYPAGSWGPENADDLMEEGIRWRYPCKNLAEDGKYCEL